MERDGGIESDWRNIILCAGASEVSTYGPLTLSYPPLFSGCPWLLKAVDRSQYWYKTRGDDPHPPVPPPQCHPGRVQHGPGIEAGVFHQLDHVVFQVGYYLDETRNFALDVEELERVHQAAKDKSDIKAIVVINTGNPTGQVLTRENMEAVIKFAAEKNLFVFAVEVRVCSVILSSFARVSLPGISAEC